MRGLGLRLQLFRRCGFGASGFRVDGTGLGVFMNMEHLDV